MAIWHDYNWDIWDGNFHNKVERFYNITLCTTVMNRLHTLKKCLPKNIEDNKDYPNIEFLILDYNSTDGLKEWVLEELKDHLKSGLVTYYRTEEPQYYSMTHSRNLAFRLAGSHKGWEKSPEYHIVNNVDADNYVQKGFGSWLNFLANEQPRKAIFSKGKRSINGRLGFFKDEWELLGGYNEEIQDYGADDSDLMYRAMASGYKLMWYGGRFQDRIRTPRSVVGENMKVKDWKKTETRNKEISMRNLENGILIANENTGFGCGEVTDHRGNTIGFC